MKRFIVYGCGTDYQNYKKLIKEREQKGEIAVVGICARELPPGDTLDGWPLIPRDKLCDTDFDAVFVLSSKYEKEIIRELLERGIDRQIIFNRYTFRLSGESLSELEQLRRDRVTILVNNCIGGHIANTLRMECCSPTKNLWITEKDFLRFLEHLDFYLPQEPVFSCWGEEEGGSGPCPFPVLALGDIKLYCNHDSDPETAIANWKRRVKKVNPQNIVAIFITQKPELEKRFYDIGSVRKKYCISSFRSTNPHTITAEASAERTWLQTAFTFAMQETDLDLVGLLNGRDPVFFE